MNALPSSRFATWAPWWVLAFVALWPAPGYAEVVLSLGAIFTLVRFVRQRNQQEWSLLSPEAWALTSLMFVAYWLPELISALDSANVWRSLREVLVDLRYLPFLWLVAIAVSSEEGRRIVFTGVGLVVGFWVLDGLCQAVTGVSLGGPITEDRLSGIFGSDNLKLGAVLASLSPFALEAAGARWRSGGWVLMALALGIVILLAGTRAAWLTYVLVLLWMGGRRFGRRRTLVLVLASGTVGLSLAVMLSHPIQARWERTVEMFSGDASGLDHALSGRLSIWRAAAHMVADHPVNGVGVRGFRDAYPAYVQPGDPPLEGGLAFHAHQIVLEVASETGAVGVLLWLAGAAMGWRAWRVASQAARDRARVPMTALVVTVFPLNTHLAFYSTFWGGLALLLAACYAGSLLARDEESDSTEALLDHESA